MPSLFAVNNQEAAADRGTTPNAKHMAAAKLCRSDIRRVTEFPLSP